MNILSRILNFIIAFCCSMTFALAEQTRTSLESEVNAVLSTDLDETKSADNKETILKRLDSKIEKAQKRNWSTKRFHRVYVRRTNRLYNRTEKLAARLDNPEAINKLYQKELKSNPEVKLEDIQNRVKKLNDKARMESEREEVIQHINSFDTEEAFLQAMKLEVEKTKTASFSEKKSISRDIAQDYGRAIKGLFMLILVAIDVLLAIIVVICFVTGLWILGGIFCLPLAWALYETIKVGIDD